MISLGAVLGFSAIPFVAMLAGGAWSAIRPPGKKLRSATQHFAAGIVIAALAVELLPEIMHRRAPVPVVVGFGLGTAVMLLVRTLSNKYAAKHGEMGMVAAIAVDIFIDGLLLGMGFALGAKAGWLLTIALTLELVVLGLAASGSFGGGKGWRMLASMACVAALVPIGAAIGVSGLAVAPMSLVEGVLSFGSVALLYLVTEELLIEAHEGEDTNFATATLFVGFLSVMIFDMVI